MGRLGDLYRLVFGLEDENKELRQRNEELEANLQECFAANRRYQKRIEELTASSAVCAKCGDVVAMEKCSCDN